MSAPTGAGFLPPQQARSREALKRLLAAAEDVLARQGLEGFTIASVAQRAGVSIGGVYRRFTGKEHLIDAVIDRLITKLQDEIAESLRAAESSLAGVVSALTHALADYLERIGPVFNSVLGAPRDNADKQERGLAAITTLRRLFLDAALTYSAEITRPAPATALTIALRAIMAAGGPPRYGRTVVA